MIKKINTNSKKIINDKQSGKSYIVTSSCPPSTSGNKIDISSKITRESDKFINEIDNTIVIKRNYLSVLGDDVFSAFDNEYCGQGNTEINALEKLLKVRKSFES